MRSNGNPLRRSCRGNQALDFDYLSSRRPIVFLDEAFNNWTDR